MIDANRSKTQEPATCSQLITRRDILKGGALGAVNLGLRQSPDLSLPRLGGASRSLILLSMVGGASPWETFDPKPDAPERFRGPFDSIASAVPGIRVSEYLPGVARRMDHLSLIRSVHHQFDPTHEVGLRLLMTGRAEEGQPLLGSKVAQELGSRGGMPPFVVLPNHVRMNERVTETLPSVFDPFVIGESAVSARFDPERLLDRIRQWGKFASIRGIGRSEGLSPISGKPWDWDAERQSTRETYGRSGFGRDCWLAGRLVEAGSRVVVVNMADTVFGRPSWDVHGRKPFSTFEDYAGNLLPAFDQGFSGLVDDLQRRELFNSTLVVAVGEFGRTPWINESGGRDHWPGVWSVLIAGGGTWGGQVIGSSDLDGQPRDRPVSVEELVATMSFALGFDASPGSVGSGCASCKPIGELFG